MHSTCRCYNNDVFYFSVENTDLNTAAAKDNSVPISSCGLKMLLVLQ